MSFGKDENNQVHESDSKFNKSVVEAIGIARATSSVSQCINALNIGQTARSIIGKKDDVRVTKRAEWTEEEIGR